MEGASSDRGEADTTEDTEVDETIGAIQFDDNNVSVDIAVLSAGSYGHAELIVTVGVSVITENGNSCKATFPTSGGDMNPDLFCDNCRSLIEATPNDGYVLADLHDLENVQLYPIEDTTIRDYTLTVGESDGGNLVLYY